MPVIQPFIGNSIGGRLEINPKAFRPGFRCDKYGSHFLLISPASRSNSCDRAVPHRRPAGHAFQGFPCFVRDRPERESDSSADENGINKKHLQRLNSIVNLASLLEFSFSKAKVQKHGAMT